MPRVNPVTNPPDVTAATAGLLLLHVPPVLPLALYETEEPKQMADGPEMVPGLGVGYTVTMCVVYPEPQKLDTE